MNYINKLLNTKYFLILKFLGIFTIFYVLNKAGINYLIYPFAFGAYFAFVWCNQNVIMTSICFILAGYIATFSIYLLLSCFFMCVIFLIFYGVHYKLKKPLKYIHILIYACTCSIPKVAVGLVLQGANIYYVFVELFIGLMFVFACVKFFECLCVRGITGRLTSIEIICAIAFIGAMSCGLCSIELYGFSFIKLFGALILLFFSYVGNVSTVMLIASSIGVGSLLFNNGSTYFCLFMLYGLSLCMFKTKNKYISSVALIIVECLCSLYFGLFAEFNVITVAPLLISCFIYIIIPAPFLDSVGGEFQDGIGGITQQSVINRNRELMHYRLVELSDVFAEMNKVFRGMIGGGIAGSDAKRMLLNEVKIKNCKNCPSQGRCFRVANGETINALNQMVNTAFEKGKVNLLDVPTLFAGKCERLNALVCSVNDLIIQYKNYAGLINNIDASKVLLAEQLSGVSCIMRDLSMEINKGVKFERGKEKRVMDELTYNNIICSDALVFQDNEDILSVTLAVRKEDATKCSISKIVSKACGNKMEIYDDVSSHRAGWQVLTLKNAPKYDLIFGIATKTKTGSTKSGDSYSVIKIKDGKYLFAICDGMGSGERAEATSSTALGLLENFFKAGFDKEIIISSVNKLLSLGKDDIFSALDLCVVDTRAGVGSFIKMGAPESFVKHKETTDVVSVGSLPLGIIQNIETKSKDVYFTSGDKVIMVSDGIIDSFKSVEHMVDYVNNLAVCTPQKLADQILEKVLFDNNNIARDDMTVIVAKIFER